MWTYPTYPRLTRIQQTLDALTQRIATMAVDTTKLVAAVAQVKADQEKNASDILAAVAKLQALPVSTDPAVQAVVDQAVTDLTATASAMETSNTSLEAATA